MCQVKDLILEPAFLRQFIAQHDCKQVYIDVNI